MERRLTSSPETGSKCVRQVRITFKAGNMRAKKGPVLDLLQQAQAAWECPPECTIPVRPYSYPSLLRRASGPFLRNDLRLGGPRMYSLGAEMRDVFQFPVYKMVTMAMMRLEEARCFR